MGTSPDVGGRTGLGRPIVPEYRELEATAQTQVAKQGLAIVPNTLEIPFTQLGGNVWKYDANSSRPTLNQTLLQGVSVPDTQKEDPAEQSTFEQLMDELPLQLSLKLKRDRKKERDERDPQLIILEKILQFFAKSLVYIDKVKSISRPSLAGSISQNQAGIAFALRGWEEHTQEMLSFPIGKTNRMLLEKALNWIALFRIQPLEKKGQALQKIYQELQEITKKIERKEIPQASSYLLHHLENLTTIFSCMKNQDAAPFLFSLSHAYLEDILGPHSRKMLQTISLISEQLPSYLKIFIPRLLTLQISFFSLISLAASGLVGSQLGKKKEHRIDQEALHSLGVRLSLGLFTETRCLDLIVDRLLDCIDTPASEKPLFKTIGELLGINLLLITVGSVQSTKLWMKSVRGRLIQLLETFKKNELLMGKTRVASSQALLSISRLNPRGYLEAIQKTILSLHLKPKDVKRESEELLMVYTQFLLGIYISYIQGDVVGMIRHAA